MPNNRSPTPPTDRRRWKNVPSAERILIANKLIVLHPRFREAIALRNPRAGLLHHTDRGGQYAGDAYRRVLERAEICQSMSRPDNCYDNAFMESCFGTVKTELEMEYYEHEGEARKEIRAYIRYYNTRRRHSSLGYLAPEEFERRSLDN